MLATSRFIKGVFDLVCTRANNRQPSINHPAPLFLSNGADGEWTRATLSTKS
jgi:hypothetical protein